MVEAKYVKQTFAKEMYKKGMVYDLANLWYFIDEVTREQTRIRGPYSRQAIKKFLEDGKFLFRDGYAWHPSLGPKWMCIDKISDIISPPPTLTDQALQEAFMRKLQLQSHSHPHLRGSLEFIYEGNGSKKWVVILDRQLAIFLTPLQPKPEIVINIEDLSDIVLVCIPKGLALKIEVGLTGYMLYSNKTDEVMEWYHAICCCRQLILSLGSEFPKLEVDFSELHICNVKSSDEYVGEKIHEGTLRKEGLKWKAVRTRWFILRTQALFYYSNKNEKNYKRFFKLTPNTKVDWQGDYKYINHISLNNSERVLHLWADSTYEKEIWVEKLMQAIQNLKNNSMGLNSW
jgi:PH domain